MKRLQLTITTILTIAALTSCTNGGDNIGGFSQPQVSVSFKQSETTAPDIALDFADMSVIFDSLVRVMAEDELTYKPDDSAFVRRVMSALFSSYAAFESGVVVGSDSVSVPRELASDYLSAFALSASLPDIGAGQSGNMYEFEYTKPSDAQTKVTDFLSNTDGTYTAYVDYVNAGVIEKRYIITLVGNAHTMAAAKYVFNYTVTAAVEFE